VDIGELNITGTSDAWPFEAQMKLIREITPNVKRLGLLFEPPRDFRRLQLLRKWSHDETDEQQVFT